MTSFTLDSLDALPAPLLNAVGQHFSNDESKVRAVFAPWCNAKFERIIDGISVWKRQNPWSFERAIRESVERDLEKFADIFSTNRPYFACSEITSQHILTSPYPDLLNDANYWAFVSQTSLGDEDFFRQRMEKPMPLYDGKSRLDYYCQQLSTPSFSMRLGLKRPRDILFQLWQDIELENSGNYR
ncbi:MAG: hypothetical protein CMF25_03315 [Kangiellaceae bacterium]|nr:hypothetical protein [Kangiellaceae bacterium]